MERLSDHTADEVNLLIYTYYRQAKEGDVAGKQPSPSNRWERRKHDVWLKCWGLSREDAIEGYIQALSMISAQLLASARSWDPTIGNVLA